MILGGIFHILFSIKGGLILKFLESILICGAVLVHSPGCSSSRLKDVSSKEKRDVVKVTEKHTAEQKSGSIETANLVSLAGHTVIEEASPKDDIKPEPKLEDAVNATKSLKTKMEVLRTKIKGLGQKATEENSDPLEKLPQTTEEIGIIEAALEEIEEAIEDLKTSSATVIKAVYRTRDQTTSETRRAAIYSIREAAEATMEAARVLWYKAEVGTSQEYEAKAVYDEACEEYEEYESFEEIYEESEERYEESKEHGSVSNN